MIGYLSGKIKSIYEDNCILNVNGVGYRIYLDNRTIETLKLNDEVEFHIHTAMREDSITLYGFLNKTDYELFEQLITVSSIGTKTALNMLSKISAKELTAAIQQEDINVLMNLPGIGKKSAQRLILELKDKFASITREQNISKQSQEEAAEALSALGYTNVEIAEVFKRVKNFMSTEELVKFALNELNRF